MLVWGAGLGGVETTTELGVIVQGGGSGRDSPPPPSYAQVTKATERPGPAGMAGGTAAGGGSAALPGSVGAQPSPLDEGEVYAERHFTLDEDEDHHSEHRRIMG